MLGISSLVRRSVLVVPVVDRDAVAAAWRHDADAVALDLSDGRMDLDRRVAWGLLPEAVASARQGGAEVFVRIHRALAYADIKAAANPGLTGVILPNPECAADVEEIDRILREREREEGFLPGALEIFLLLGTARGIWNVRALVNASTRIASVAIDEPNLCRSMGITPTEEFDPLGFSRGRVLVETLAAVRLPLGMGHPLGAMPQELAAERLQELAVRARNTGFKGAVCPFPSWVAACNTAFTPTSDQVAYYRDVRKAFADGVARGTAAVPFPGGRMIDVPVDERARLVIDWWERCRRRDEAKAAARQRQSV